MNRRIISPEEREARLWEANNQCIRGEISAEQLADIVFDYSIDPDIEEDIQKIRRIRFYLGLAILVIFSAWFVLGLIDVLFSGNWGLLVVALLSLLPLYYILSRYFFDRETQKATGS